MTLFAIRQVTKSHFFVTPKRYALAIHFRISTYMTMEWQEIIRERMKMLGMKSVADLARACKSLDMRKVYRIYDGVEPRISDLFALCEGLQLKLRHFERDAVLPPAKVEVEVPGGMTPQEFLELAYSSISKPAPKAARGSSRAKSEKHEPKTQSE